MIRIASLRHAKLVVALATLDGCGRVDTIATDVAAATSSPSGNASPATPNRSPIVLGTPLSSIRVGSAYRFQPTATDADGDPLVWSISGKPSWGVFDSETGALTGTPVAGNVGSYANILVSVSDGKATANLAAFTLSVQATPPGFVRLRWLPPTHNTDGSLLTDLSSYRIYHSTANPAELLAKVELRNPALTGYLYDNLAPGTHYFAIAAINGAGTESRLSNVLVQVLP